MLRDATGLCGHDLALPQAVQQGGFPMIHVTHDGDHRGAWHQQGGVSWRSKRGQSSNLMKSTAPAVMSQ